MTDRPKAAAGMVWLPRGADAMNRLGLCIGSQIRAEWTSPARVNHCWADEATWMDGLAQTPPTPGVVVELDGGRLFYPGLDLSVFLELLSSAWDRRGGR